MTLRGVAKVGYAFVNFVSVQALYRFVKARVGKRWNMFSSEKVLQVGRAVSSHDLPKLTLQVSYANIQSVAVSGDVLGADTVIAEARRRSSTNSGRSYRLL